ncbi:MAG: hypothetical protein ISS52_00795 [Dehalococcoidia bacterium]|nr:hypothetical protein [Dehalococcoidia bacterium]
MSEWSEKLNQMKLGEFRKLYGSLEYPPIPSLVGYYQGSFVGPGWLRKIAGPGLVVSGLGGWWGKRFSGDGTATNLVQRGGVLETRFPMRLVAVTSVIDENPGLALHYETDNPFPWPHIADELRQLAPGALLGMTYVKARVLRGLMLPFLLEHQEGVDGL